jgi:sucrose-6-phosphate hydrolase SacC (GH32 family)
MARGALLLACMCATIAQDACSTAEPHALLKQQQRQRQRQQQQQQQQQQRHPLLDPAERPAWHMRPPTGILSDICGTVWFRGVYHVFFQHHDPPPATQAMQWGHAASKDAAHWRYLQPAILPDSWFDRHGAWDGSIALDSSGIPRLIFSCLPSNGTNMLCTASPKNASDPWLEEWEVAPQPVVRHFPPGGNRFDFRDPAVLRLAGPTPRPWLAAVASSVGTGPSGGAGGQPLRNGSVVVYRSADFQRWDYDGIAWSNDQFGSSVLECPELFALTDSSRWVLRFQPNCRDLYVVGGFRADSGAQFVGDHRQVRLVDGGLFCASRSMDARGGRRVIIGAVNCDSSDVYDSYGWCGVASALRTLTPHPHAPGLLAVEPMQELEQLRGETPLVALRSTVVSSETPTQLQLRPPGAGLSLDATVTVHGYALRPGVRGIGVRVRQHANSEHAEVAVDWLNAAWHADVELVGEALGHWLLPLEATHSTIPELCGKACEATADCVGWSVTPGSDRCDLKHTIPPATPHAAGSGFLSGNIACHYLAVRRTTLGLATQTPDRILRLDSSLTETTAAANWTIRVLVDRSLIEAFAFGRAVSARFYPRAQENASTVSVVALGSQATVDVDVWPMPLD